MTHQAVKSLMSCDPVSDSIITARIRSNVRNITIIQCYVPTDKNDYKNSPLKDAFYSKLSVPKGDVIIVMGDFNASLTLWSNKALG